MVVLKHYRRQTGLLVVCLFPIAAVTGEVLRMMDCGKQAAKLTIPPVGFAFLLSRSGRRRLTLQIQAVLQLKLVVAGRRFKRYFRQRGRPRGLLECYCKWWYYDASSATSSSADSENERQPRKRRGSTLPQD
jgi:hypothetical protein